MPGRIVITVLCCFILANTSFSQADTLAPVNYKKRRIILISAGSAFALGSLAYLNQAWYSEYSSGKFHFFNDNAEWLQMDKVGHTFSTYQSSRLMMDAFSWAGYGKSSRLFAGGCLGLGYMTAIEVMDGFSSGWGFSWGDELANVLGTSAAVAQEGLWAEQRIQLKFSFAQSGLAKYNPSLLGETVYTQVLKDYNAQTLWLSVNPSTFMKKDSRFPKWLSLAFGYSAYGMLGGHENNFAVTNGQGQVLKFERVRRYYVSLDVDLTRIKTKSKFLKGLFSVVNVLKFPAPALQLSQGKLRGYWLYY